MSFADGPQGDDATDDFVARAIEGDEAALEELLREHAPSVCRTVTVDERWKSEFDLDDLVQVTSMEVVLRIQDLRSPSLTGFRAWLKRIAENNVRDAVRALGTRKRTPPGKRITQVGEGASARTLLYHVAGPDPTASSIMGEKEDLDLLHAAIDRLPPDYRRVVRALDLDERPVADVAEELGRSNGAVHMLHTRAHDRLRELLQSPATGS